MFKKAIKIFLSWSLLLFAGFILLISSQLPVMAEPLQETGGIFLEVEAGKVTLRARDADLEELLQQLARRAGFELFIYEDIRKKVTIDIRDLSLEEALKILLPNYGFLFRRTPEGDLALRAVAVVRSRKGRGEFSGGFVKDSLGQLAYGDGPGEIGRINIPGVERQGPKSFAVSGAGDMYICDTINGRVQVYGTDGKLKRIISSGGHPSDIAVSESGETFLLNEEKGSIFRYGHKGERLGDITVPRALLNAVESFRTFENRILLRTRDGEEYEIDPGRGGKEGYTKGPFRGSRITPDLSCLVRKVSGSAGEVTIIARGGEVLDTIPVPIERLASIVFLASDEEMNLFLQIEQISSDGPGVDLGVIKLNPAGILLNTIDYIPNPYANWTVRLLQVNSKGDIYQMLPGPEAVELNRWSCAPGPEKNE